LVEVTTGRGRVDTVGNCGCSRITRGNGGDET
jgi:hypothetical protein